MASDQAYEPALPLISVLAPCAGRFASAARELTREWDQLRFTVPAFLFDHTRYYEPEIGFPLLRWWGYRHRLADPSALTAWKRTCRRIEDQLRDGEGNRRVNIDPGYLNYSLVVLGSGKYDQQKIYLGEGVYADPILKFGEGDFHPFPWSFPDFKRDAYYDRLKGLRRRYKQLRRNTNH